MESLTTYSASLNVYELTFRMTDTELIIEAERMIDFKFFSTKLTNEKVGEVTNQLFLSIQEVFQAFIAALDSSLQNTKLTISQNAKLTFSHKTLIGKVEIPLKFDISLEEVQDDPILRQQRTISKLVSKVEKLQAEIATLKKVGFVQLHPTFDVNDTYKGNFIFSDNNRKILRTMVSNTMYQSIAKDPLPQEGKHKFSAKVLSNPGHILIGVVVESSKMATHSQGVNGSCHFYIHMESNSVYCNGNSVALTNYIASTDDTISVLVNFDEDEILFEVNDIIVHRRKYDFKSFQQKFYPCVNTYNINDSVTFL